MTMILSRNLELRHCLGMSAGCARLNNIDDVVAYCEHGNMSYGWAMFTASIASHDIGSREGVGIGRLGVE